MLLHLEFLSISRNLFLCLLIYLSIFSLISNVGKLSKSRFPMLSIDKFLEINKPPLSSNEIKCRSNKASTLGERRIPLSTSKRSSSLDSDYGTI